MGEVIGGGLILLGVWFGVQACDKALDRMVENNKQKDKVRCEMLFKECLESKISKFQCRVNLKTLGCNGE